MLPGPSARRGQPWPPDRKDSLRLLCSAVGCIQQLEHSSQGYVDPDIESRHEDHSRRTERSDFIGVVASTLGDLLVAEAERGRRPSDEILLCSREWTGGVFADTSVDIFVSVRLSTSLRYEVTAANERSIAAPR
ncbi:hypothetical protein GCM10027169_16110 [Gordonia jinhuaensis]